MFHTNFEASASVPLKSVDARKETFVNSLTKELENKFATVWLIENKDPADARNQLDVPRQVAWRVIESVYRKAKDFGFDYAEIAYTDPEDLFLTPHIVAHRAESTLGGLLCA